MKEPTVQPDAYESYEAYHEAHLPKVAPAESLARWAHHQILAAISSSTRLQKTLVFKGGNALRSAHGSARATKDLDFSVDATITEAVIRAPLERALSHRSDRSDILLRVQSFKANPKDPESTRRTWIVTIGYALKSNLNILNRLKRDPPLSPTVIPLEISENEATGTYEVGSITGAEQLQVSTVENIIAEKLRALIQQQIRRRHRPQDVFDIAYQCRRAKDGQISPLNLQSIRQQFVEKCERRDVLPHLEHFDGEEIWTLAEQGYSEMQATVSGEFISFPDARAELEELIAELKKLF